MINWSEQDQVFIATVPEIENLNAFGSTPEEALREIEVAKELVLQVMTEDCESIPSPTTYASSSGQLRLRMPKTLHASLSHEAKEEGVSLNTYINHLLSERNALLKVKKEIEKNNRITFAYPLSATAATLDQFINIHEPVVQSNYVAKTVAEWMYADTRSQHKGH